MLRFTNLLKDSLPVAVVLLAGAAFAAGQTSFRPLPAEELEKYDDPPNFVSRTGVSPAMISQHDAFTSVQVNVNANGQNITGDAANEPSITVDPNNGNRMSIGWRQFDTVTSNFRQGGYGFSTNRGASWTFPGVLENNVFRSDPVLGADTSSNFFYLSLLGTFFDTMWRSQDGGATWTNIAPAKGGDKQWFTIDNTNSSGHGFQYQAWSTSGNPFGTRQFTRSTDGGFTWLDPINIPNTPAWGTLDVDSNGILFIGGVNLGTGQFWCIRSSNAKDGGVIPTFDQSTRVDLGGSIIFGGGINPEGLGGQTFLVADRSGTATNNNIYMMASVLPNGAGNGSDVMFARSTNGGQTFSAPLRVNDDPVNQNKWHWFGTLAVAPNGRIDSVWLDSRNAANNTDSQLFYSFSTDGGLSWAPNVSVSNSFNPFLGYPNQNKLGDYITIVSDNTGGDVAYAATFNGEQDVYYVRVAPPANALSLVNAQSVKNNFGIDLPLSGTPGIEDRSGGANSRFTVTFTFNNTLASVASATVDCGQVGSRNIDSTDAHRYIVNLRGVTCNASNVVVTLNGIVDGQGNNLPTASVTMGLLLGDVDGDGSVTKADFEIARADQGQTTDNTNFRVDINTNGIIDRTDANIVKRQRGTSLP